MHEVEPNQPFDGLEDLFTYDSGSPNATHLNVVFVHGMGHHAFGEPGIRKYQKRIAKELGVPAEDVKQVDWVPSARGRRKGWRFNGG